MKYLSLLLILLLLPFAKAEPIEFNDEVSLDDLYCTTTGQMGLKLTPTKEFGTAQIKGILIKQAGTNTFTAINGEWSRKDLVWTTANLFRTATFTSEEAEIRNKGTQELKISYSVDGKVKDIEFAFDCPGTEFSCKLFDVGVDSCSSNKGVFTAEFRTTGLVNDRYNELPKYTLDDLNILLTTDNRYCDKTGACGRSAGIPETATLEQLSNDRLKLTWEYESNVKGASISLEPAINCDKRELDYEYSVFDYKSCDQDPYVETFKCTGCELGSVCVLEGKSIIVEGNDLYCVNGELSEQKKTGMSCSVNIECLTNTCIAGVCADELLDNCFNGILTGPCKCGATDVRGWGGMSCCDGTVVEGECPAGTDINSPSGCPDGYSLVGDKCVEDGSSSSGGFWSKLGNFFKKMFSRR